MLANPPELELAVVQLVRVFERAEADIESRLNATSGPVTRQVRTQRRNEIGGILGALRELLNPNAGTEAGPLWDLIRTAYKTGSDRALEGIGARGVEKSLGGIHLDAARILFENAAAAFDNALDHVGRQTDDVFRRAALQEITTSELSGRDRRATSGAIERNLRDRGARAFIDSRGARWKLSTYSEMVARTTSREVHTTATLTRLTENGIDTVRWITGGGEKACEPCQSRHRKVYSITGATEGYPLLTEAPPLHPRCRCIVAPFIAELVASEDVPELADASLESRPQDNKYPDTVFELDGMDEGLKDKVLAQLDLLADEWPDAAGRIKRVSIEPGTQPYVAAADLGQRMGDNTADIELKFAGNLWEDATLLDAKLKEHQETKFLHAGATTPEAVVTHEFGHVLDSYLTGLDDKQLTPYRNLDEGIGSVARIHGTWKKKHKPTTKLSGYATSNADEGFAEGFSAMYHHPKPETIPYVKAQREELEALAPANHLPENHAQYYDAPAEDKERERKRTVDLARKLGLTK